MATLITSRVIELSGLQTDHFADASVTKPKLNSNAGFIPTGAVIPFAANITLNPIDWLPCDGSQYAINDYPKLAEAINVIYGPYTDSEGNPGNTHFTLPDLRYRFIRGWAAGKSLIYAPEEATRIFGSFQDNELQIHDHSISISTDEHNHTWSDDGYGGTGTGFAAGNVRVNFVQVNFTGPDHNHSITIAPVGTETRPRNFSVFYYIKT